MAEIITKDNRTILVDNSDYDYLSQFTWGVGSHGYAVRYNWKPNRKAILMHREIMNPAKGLQVDHINRNKLDNRRQNLRACTNAQNVRNTLHRSTNKLGLKHICLDKLSNMFKVQITIDGKKVYHNTFKTLEKATKARDKALQQWEGTY